MSFLDENCIIFDNDDENKLEYTSIHNVSLMNFNLKITRMIIRSVFKLFCQQEFKKIVDELLSELMAELDIT